jgi:hypothetical protein
MPVTRTTDWEARWTPAAAAEDLRDPALVQHRPEPGEQLARGGRHDAVDRREHPGLADRLGQRRRRGPAHRTGHEPHEQGDGDDRGDPAED